MQKKGWNPDFKDKKVCNWVEIVSCISPCALTFLSSSRNRAPKKSASLKKPKDKNSNRNPSLQHLSDKKVYQSS